MRAGWPFFFTRMDDRGLFFRGLVHVFSRRVSRTNLGVDVRYREVRGLELHFSDHEVILEGQMYLDKICCL